VSWLWGRSYVMVKKRIQENHFEIVGAVTNTEILTKADTHQIWSLFGALPGEGGLTRWEQWEQGLAEARIQK